MASNLVIVESPTKAKTISKFLGSKYVVKASMGHVRDLPKSNMGVDIEHNFEPKYIIPVDKKKIISELKSYIKTDTTVWLATDEDREGEAIGWHLTKALNLTKQKIYRIVFHEITKSALDQSIKNPRDIDINLVNAQQARRVLDRLVGYELSPFLWKKVRYGLSAGRVQSVAVRLIVDRENEIRAFKSEEYWSITALFNKKNDFEAKLHFIDSKKFKLSNEKDAQQVLENLKNANYVVSVIEKKQISRNPAPPFTTSTLQQEAGRKLNMSVSKTMLVAQQLYEGLDIGEGSVGLITYMRTDSVNLSKQALDQSGNVITELFGKEFTLVKPRFYKSKKGAQEAHEAIRPTDLSRTPEFLKKFLNKEQYKLYELIWKRTLACQMAEAIFDRVSVDIENRIENRELSAEKDKLYTFRATGQTVKFPGFMKVYKESFDEPQEDDDQEKILPNLVEGDEPSLKKLTENQHFTEPPARYTEASLVKKLESEGIGRPSTYAPTISTIIKRQYVIKEKACLKPTDTGEVVNNILVKHFSQIVDYQFTAKMEEDLDNIAEGKIKWEPVIDSFYHPFHDNITQKQTDLQKSDLITEETNEICDKCGAKMEIKLGRYGKFLSCSNYPTCKNAKPLRKDGEDKEMKKLEAKLSDKKCHKCGEPMLIKTGRFGEFLACSGYPKCKNIESIVKYTGVDCPVCKDGKVIEKRTKRGKIFYGCNKYPKCKFASWDEPVNEKCPKCKSLVVKKKDSLKCSKCDWKK
ncbi:DNA topoisomerase I [Candidatus Peregrinibacteria bacterium RIFOXYA12_FULL_33_12]|nr:MAG: DNA topoisomerase I [Candidatus Peregrinibacteria bacterium RIFOXYA12_FULL_33_12]OGJ46246.1 MAG: DNA topoisomerase I [Candidatus Peregrinibacteria bacterium RIFOXYA2_FULL_33_21]OGJ51651.1 MAG: DNA topoisomerase I [Candidatus Peregrinibacteria bacterium RIFOXYB2_FULL_33_20]